MDKLLIASSADPAEESPLVRARTLTVPQSEALDGLRGISILVVMLFHLGMPWFQWGFLGVDMFFTISGLVITQVLIEELENTNNVAMGRFYLRRAGRLLPALLLLILLLSLAMFVRPVNRGLLLPTIGWSLSYALNWALIAGIPIHGALSHTWSLAVEEQFYLVWPIFLRATRLHLQNWNLVVGIGSTVIILVGATRFYLWHGGASIQRLYNGSDLRTDALVLGALLCLDGRARGWSRHVWASKAAFLGIGCYLLFAPWRSGYGSAHLYQGGLTVVAFGTAGAISEALRSGGGFNRFLRVMPLRWLGKTSYSLYLWHFPIILAFPRHPAFAVVLTFAAASISFYGVESPIRNSVRRLAKKI